MKSRAPKPQTREEIEEALRRLQHALQQAGADTPAGIAFSLAIRRLERALADLQEGGTC